MSGNSLDNKIKQITEGVLAFREALSGHPFYAYQQTFARRVVDALLRNEGSTITALWSRQAGKTTAVGELGITLAILMPALARLLSDDDEWALLRPYKEGFRLGIFAPVKDQAGLAYGKMRDIAHSDRCQEILNDEELRVAITTSRGDSLTFSNGSVIHAKTASPDSKIEGFTYHAILIDEAQAVDRFKVEKEIEPMRASTNGIMVKIGTAWISRGGFHSDIEYNIESFKRGGSRNHYEFPASIVIAEKEAMYTRDKNPFHLAYKSYVEGQRKKLGEDSLAFRMNFKLMWQDSRLDAISAKALLNCQVESRELNVFTPLAPGWIRVGGLDIAKAGDSTVATVVDVDLTTGVYLPDEDTMLYTKYVVGLLELQGNFEANGPDPGQYQRIIDFFGGWHGLETVCLDCTGIGIPVSERLQALNSDLEWQEFKYSASSKSELFKHFLDEWEGDRIKLASGGDSRDLHQWNQFIDQHKNLEREYKGPGNQYLDCHAPIPTGKTAKISMHEYHDDYPNSAALACWAAKKRVSQGEVTVDYGYGNSNNHRAVRAAERASRYRSRRTR